MVVFDFRRIMLLVMACVLGLMVSSCTKEDEDAIVMNEKALLGEWGFAGIPIIKFTEDKVFLYDSEDGVWNNVKYRINPNNNKKIDVLGENGKWISPWEIKRLDNDLLGLQGSDYTIWAFRILDEENTIGDFSLIYNKDWVMPMGDNEYMLMNFKKDGKVVTKGFVGGKVVDVYDSRVSYDEKNKKLVISGEDGPVTCSIKKLTEKILFLDVQGEGTWELRTISVTGR